VNAAAERWQEPDRGLWELRGPPRHHVHSKVLCWVALDRGLKLAEECLRQAPIRRWHKARELFDRAASCGSDLGLYPEEFDSDREELLGNNPQGLSYLSHIAAAVALAQPYGPGTAVDQHDLGAGQQEQQIEG
jgi:GH15 family glucan-1,4-alpha-glucosidase